jgi:low temperature requirement protein LtrA
MSIENPVAAVTRALPRLDQAVVEVPMNSRRARRGVLRGDGERNHQVASMELFYDLVYVFAIIRLSGFLFDHLNLQGVWQAGLLLLAIWWAWVDTAWLTNWFDPERGPVRVMLVGVMVATLVMATALPQAFGDRGLLFAVGLAAAQAGKFAFAVVWTRDRRGLHRNFERVFSWRAAAGVLWLAGGLASGAARGVLWTAAVTIDSLGPLLGFPTPGLGRSTTHDWNISAAHMAERCKLFLLIALGESILVAFLGSVALWLVYVDPGFGVTARAFAASADPGRVGLIAYTYLHVPMVAGIILTAVGDELAIAHPRGHAGAATVAAVLGGPALFLAGQVLFGRAVLAVWPVSRLVGIAALGLIAPVGRDWSPLALSASALLVVAAFSWWDRRAAHDDQLLEVLE